MKKKITLIKIFIITGYLGVPLATVLFFYGSSRSWGHILFLLFMLFHAFERVWETFYTTKEKHADEIHGDWTLAVVTFAYLLLCFLTIGETYTKVNNYNVAVTGFGLALYGISFRLRWWGMKSLGQQWAIHAVGAQKISRVRLIRIGAFKYIRHPIYLSIMIEVVSIPMVGNAFWGILFAVCINVPLQLLRLILEEKSSSRRFGDDYENYKKEVSMLFPIKFLKKKPL